MRIFGIAKRRPSAEVAGSAISLALDTRQTVGDELGLLHWRRFSRAPTIIAVGTRVTSRPPHIYGPAARCKRINWMGHAVRFNLSGLWLEHALRAIMEIRAQLSSLDPRPRGPCAGPDFSRAGETVVPSFSLSLANLGGGAPDFLLGPRHTPHAPICVGGVV